MVPSTGKTLTRFRTLTAINAWKADEGGDVSEGQLYTLDQLAQPPGGTIGWRAGAKRIIATSAGTAVPGARAPAGENYPNGWGIFFVSRPGAAAPSSLGLQDSVNPAGADLFTPPAHVLCNWQGECGKPLEFSGAPLEFSNVSPVFSNVSLEFSVAPLEKSGGCRSFSGSLWNSLTRRRKILWAAGSFRQAVGILRRAAGKVWKLSKFSGVSLEFSDAPSENTVGRRKFPASRWNSPACRRESLEAVEIFWVSLEFSNVPLENASARRSFRGATTKFYIACPNRRRLSRFHGTG